ncbi:MAG TPA: A/G-specific adenine glycosylase [Thermoplasmata archaeon]|nr:A/G-specific adenine glycosylase [Thermoplasmata archaeon]
MTRAGAESRRGPDARFGRLLVRWFLAHQRPLPWRRNPTPYRVWVSEVLLQQTRVAQAIPYFGRFLQRFPTLRSAARASEQDVLKVWEGAGYYARARNLHAAAVEIVRRFQGRLPESPEILQTLPGFGAYLASAVASIAYGRPVPAVDGNVLRVASRLTLERGDVRQPSVRRRLTRRAGAWMPKAAAGSYNQAMMELGETICLPRRPRCPECPVSRFCRARQELPDPGQLPHHGIRRNVPVVDAAVGAIEFRGRWLVQRRPREGLLGGLWEFPGGKIRSGEKPEAALRREIREETGLELTSVAPISVVAHSYSHFRVRLHLFLCRAAHAGNLRTRAARRWVSPQEFRLLPRPAATVRMARLLPSPLLRGRASRGSRSRPGRRPA